MVDTLCNRMKNVHFENENNVNTLVSSMKHCSIQEPTLKTNRVTYILNCMKGLPKISKNAKRELETDYKNLQRRIEREIRMRSKLKINIMYQKEKQKEHDVDVDENVVNEEFEESYVENTDEHQFDIDDFNDS